MLPISSFNDFNEMHKSVLQEICNMGAGNAATSISQMISSPTDISVPKVKINPPSLAGSVVNMLSKSSVPYLINFSADVLGKLLFIFPYPFIDRMVGTFFPGFAVNEGQGLDEMSASIIGETVNLSAAAYANSLSLMTGLTVDISTPEAVTDPGPKIITPDTASSICFVNNYIEILDCHKSYSALFYPDLDSVNKIMGKLGMEF